MAWMVRIFVVVVVFLGLRALWPSPREVEAPEEPSEVRVTRPTAPPQFAVRGSQPALGSGGGSSAGGEAGMAVRDRMRQLATGDRGREEVRAAVDGEEEEETEEEREEFAELSRTALEDPDPDERSNAISSIALTGNLARALPVLGQALNDPSSDVRLAALDVLGDMENGAPVPLLQQALDDVDEEVRLKALDIVENFVDEPIMSQYQRLVEGAINDPNSEVRERARDILGLDPEDYPED